MNEHFTFWLIRQGSNGGWFHHTISGGYIWVTLPSQAKPFPGYEDAKKAADKIARGDGDCYIVPFSAAIAPNGSWIMT